MPSFHQQLMRDYAAPVVNEHFVERNNYDDVRYVTITPPKAPQSKLWAASVGPLTPRMLMIGGRSSIEMRQTVELIGDTAGLPEGFTSLPEGTFVWVPRYGEPSFQVYPDLCSFGAVRTKLTVVRQQITRIGNNHAERAG